jgi:hypothetical protein
MKVVVVYNIKRRGVGPMLDLIIYWATWRFFDTHPSHVKNASIGSVAL